MGSKKFKNKAKQVKVEQVKKEPNLTVRRLFSSLINNRSAYDGGRLEAGWIATLLFIFSIVMSLVPAMVTIGKTKGSDSLSTNLYHTDVALVKFVEKLDAENVDLEVIEVNGAKLFSDKSTGFASKVATATYNLIDEASSINEEIPYYSFSQQRLVNERDEETGEVVPVMKDFEYLRVYYTADFETRYIVGNTSYEISYLLSSRLLNLSGDAMKDNVTSHMIIGRMTMYTRLYNPNEINNPGTTATRFEGRTSSLPVGMNIRDFGLVEKDGVTPISKTDIDYSEKVVDNFANLQDLAYRDVKIQSFWIQTGIYAVIFSVIGLVMGVVIFISTRGKNNPYRDLKFTQAMKIGAWLLPTPALLTLILGFILPASYFQMIFIMALGMRSVWLTMRTLTPTQQ